MLDKLLLINKPNVNATVCLKIDGENVYMSGGVYQGGRVTQFVKTRSLLRYETTIFCVTSSIVSP